MSICPIIIDVLKMVVKVTYLQVAFIIHCGLDQLKVCIINVCLDEQIVRVKGKTFDLNLLELVHLALYFPLACHCVY